MGNDSVEDAIREIEASRIACSELDTFSNPFLYGEMLCHLRQVGAKIDSGNPSRKTGR